MYSDHFRRLARYEQWANERVLHSLAILETNAPHSALHLMGHLLAAADIWLRRIQGLSLEGVQVFPHATLEQCRDMYEKTTHALLHFCDDLSDEQLNTVITYKNVAGTEFTTSLADILTHIFNHATYHRAQIATRLREGGFTPAITDFIAFTR